jgi:hypothetical protein
LFLGLDVYYLALESMFRESYNAAIDKLHTGRLTAQDLYVVSPMGNSYKTILASLGSFSIWPFYLTLLVMIIIAGVIVS